MTLTGTSARYELLANADLSSVNTTGSAQVGTPSTAMVYATAPDVAYSLAMFITAGETISLTVETGAVTGTITGTNQVETATVVSASGITSDGDCVVVFTSASTGVVNVTVALTTAASTAFLIAYAIVSALAANTTITAEFTISSSGADIIVTRTNKRSNDATLNIAIPAGIGITAAPTSANTTAGVGEAAAYRMDGYAWDQSDFEGRAIPSASLVYSTLIRPISGGDISIGAGTLMEFTTRPGAAELSCYANGDHPWVAAAVDFTPVEDALIYIDVHAGI